MNNILIFFSIFYFINSINIVEIKNNYIKENSIDNIIEIKFDSNVPNDAFITFDILSEKYSLNNKTDEYYCINFTPTISFGKLNIYILIGENKTQTNKYIYITNPISLNKNFFSGDNESKFSDVYIKLNNRIFKEQIVINGHTFSIIDENNEELNKNISIINLNDDSLINMSTDFNIKDKIFDIENKFSINIIDPLLNPGNNDSKFIELDKNWTIGNGTIKATFGLSGFFNIFHVKNNSLYKIIKSYDSGIINFNDLKETNELIGYYSRQYDPISGKNDSNIFYKIYYGENIQHLFNINGFNISKKCQMNKYDGVTLEITPKNNFLIPVNKFNLFYTIFSLEDEELTTQLIVKESNNSYIKFVENEEESETDNKFLIFIKLILTLTYDFSTINKNETVFISNTIYINYYLFESYNQKNYDDEQLKLEVHYIIKNPEICNISLNFSYNFINSITEKKQLSCEIDKEQNEMLYCDISNLNYNYYLLYNDDFGLDDFVVTKSIKYSDIFLNYNNDYSSLYFSSTNYILDLIDNVKLNNQTKLPIGFFNIDSINGKYSLQINNNEYDDEVEKVNINLDKSKVNYISIIKELDQSNVDIDCFLLNALSTEIKYNDVLYSIDGNKKLNINLTQSLEAECLKNKIKFSKNNTFLDCDINSKDMNSISCNITYPSQEELVIYDQYFLNKEKFHIKYKAFKYSFINSDNVNSQYQCINHNNLNILVKIEYINNINSVAIVNNNSEYTIINNEFNFTPTENLNKISYKIDDVLYTLDTLYIYAINNIENASLKRNYNIQKINMNLIGLNNLNEFKLINEYDKDDYYIIKYNENENYYYILFEEKKLPFNLTQNYYLSYSNNQCNEIITKYIFTVNLNLVNINYEFIQLGYDEIKIIMEFDGIIENLENMKIRLVNSIDLENSENYKELFDIFKLNNDNNNDFKYYFILTPNSFESLKIEIVYIDSDNNEILKLLLDNHLYITNPISIENKNVIYNNNFNFKDLKINIENQIFLEQFNAIIYNKEDEENKFNLKFKIDSSQKIINFDENNNNINFEIETGKEFIILIKDYFHDNPIYFSILIQNYKISRQFLFVNQKTTFSLFENESYLYIIKNNLLYDTLEPNNFTNLIKEYNFTEEGDYKIYYSKNKININEEFNNNNLYYSKIYVKNKNFEFFTLSDEINYCQKLDEENDDLNNYIFSLNFDNIFNEIDVHKIKIIISFEEENPYESNSFEYYLDKNKFLLLDKSEIILKDFYIYIYETSTDINNYMFKSNKINKLIYTKISNIIESIREFNIINNIQIKTNKKCIIPLTLSLIDNNNDNNDNNIFDLKCIKEINEDKIYNCSISMDNNEFKNSGIYILSSNYGNLNNEFKTTLTEEISNDNIDISPLFLNQDYQKLITIKSNKVALNKIKVIYIYRKISEDEENQISNITQFKYDSINKEISFNFTFEQISKYFLSLERELISIEDKNFIVKLYNQMITTLNCYENYQIINNKNICESCNNENSFFYINKQTNDSSCISCQNKYKYTNKENHVICVDDCSDELLFSYEDTCLEKCENNLIENLENFNCINQNECKGTIYDNQCIIMNGLYLNNIEYENLYEFTFTKNNKITFNFTKTNNQRNLALSEFTLEYIYLSNSTNKEAVSYYCSFNEFLNTITIECLMDLKLIKKGRYNLEFNYGTLFVNNYLIEIETLINCDEAYKNMNKEDNSCYFCLDGTYYDSLGEKYNKCVKECINNDDNIIRGIFYDNDFNNYYCRECDNSLSLYYNKENKSCLFCDGNIINEQCILNVNIKYIEANLIELMDELQYITIAFSNSIIENDENNIIINIDKIILIKDDRKIESINCTLNEFNDNNIIKCSFNLSKTSNIINSYNLQYYYKKEKFETNYFITINENCNKKNKIFSDNLECLSCPTNTYYYNNNCYVDCPEETGKFIENKEEEVKICVNCKKDLINSIKVNGFCVERFNEDLCFTENKVLNENTNLCDNCVNIYEKNIYFYNNSCVEKCDLNEKYLYNETYIDEKNNIVHNLICLDSCNENDFNLSIYVNKNNEKYCVSECPNDYLLYEKNNTCIEINPLISINSNAKLTNYNKTIQFITFTFKNEINSFPTTKNLNQIQLQNKLNNKIIINSSSCEINNGNKNELICSFLLLNIPLGTYYITYIDSLTNENYIEKNIVLEINKLEQIECNNLGLTYNLKNNSCIACFDGKRYNKETDLCECQIGLIYNKQIDKCLSIEEYLNDNDNNENKICPENYCSNNGECKIRNDNNKFYCDCFKGFIGKICNIIDDQNYINSYFLEKGEELNNAFLNIDNNNVLNSMILDNNIFELIDNFNDILNTKNIIDDLNYKLTEKLNHGIDLIENNIDINTQNKIINKTLDAINEIKLNKSFYDYDYLIKYIQFSFILALNNKIKYSSKRSLLQNSQLMEINNLILSTHNTFKQFFQNKQIFLDDFTKTQIIFSSELNSSMFYIQIFTNNKNSYNSYKENSLKYSLPIINIENSLEEQNFSYYYLQTSFNNLISYGLDTSTTSSELLMNSKFDLDLNEIPINSQIYEFPINYNNYSLINKDDYIFYYNKKIDIFNSNDKAFIDSCFISKDFDYDLTQKFRRKKVYSNYSIKEFNNSDNINNKCNYNGLNEKNKYIILNCININIDDFSIGYRLVDKNLDININKEDNLIFKCHQFKNVGKNIGFIFYLILSIIFISIIVIISFTEKKIKKNESLTNKDIQNNNNQNNNNENNINENNNNENNNINSLKEDELINKKISNNNLNNSLNDNNNNSNQIHKQNNNKSEKNFNNNNNIFYKENSTNSINNTHIELNNNSQNKNDNIKEKIFSSIFWNNLKNLHPILRFIFIRTKLSIIFFFYTILLIFTSNSFFFFESKIEERIYKPSNRNKIFYPISNHFSIIIFSVLLTIFISILLRIFFDLFKKYNLIKNILYCIMFAFYIFCCFYTFVFCSMYFNSQKEWIFCGIWSLLFIWILMVLCILIFTIFNKKNIISERFKCIFSL